MDDDLKQNLTAGETWIRGLFILLFAFFLVIARIVTGAVVVIQFLFTVFTGRANDNLKNFGAALSRYIYQCLLFVTYNSDDKPFPFDDWPEAKVLTEEKAAVKTASPKAASETAPKAAPKATPKKKASRKKSTVKKSTAKKKAVAKTEEKTEEPSTVETQPEANSTPEADTGSVAESSSGTENKPES